MSKKDVYRAVSERIPQLLENAEFIWNHPETGGNEKISADYYRQMMTDEGFSVTNDQKMPHAFYAEYGSGRPVIAVLGEYDALPNLSQKVCTVKDPAVSGGPGHGCGHNLLGAAAAAGTIALRRIMEEEGIEGTIRFYGCPEEELLSGKVKMICHDMFSGCDAAVSWHPMSVNAAYDGGYLASVSVHFDFTGISSHAAVAPEKGRSALDAVELMNVGVNYLREHVIDKARIHYTTDSGSYLPNIVPDRAGSWYFIRAPHMNDVREILARVEKCCQGAAIMTETSGSSHLDYGCYEMQENTAFGDLAYENLMQAPLPEYTEDELAFAAELQSRLDPGVVNRDRAAIGYARTNGILHREVGDRDLWSKLPLTASTDTGDVSFVMPMCCFTAACWPLGVAPHTWLASAAAGSSIGKKGAVYAAHVIAGIAYDLLTDGKSLAAVTEEFARRSGRYESLLDDRYR